MGRGLKIGGGILAVVVVVIVGFIIFVYSSLDSLVKQAVEDHGPRYTGVTVTLSEVELQPESGRGRLSGLIVGNPAGYRTAEAFRLGSIALEVDIASLRSDTILIRKIEIDGPDITYEFGEGGSNVDVIGRNVEKAAGGPKDGGDAKPGRKMVIESLVITNGRVSISHPLLEGRKLGSTLPAIRLKDIGKDSKDGATPAEVVDKVMDAVERQVAAAVGSTDVENLVKGLGRNVEDAVKGVTGGSVGKGVGGAARDAGDTLKKLFGK